MFTDKPGKPSTPEMTTATNQSISLSWQAPEQDGGADITNYIVEYRQEGDFKWKQLDDKVPETKTIVKKLKEGGLYEFRVAAQNKAGVGPFSDPTQPIKCKEPVCKY